MLDKLCIRATRDTWGIGGIVGSVRELRIPCWCTHSVVYASPLDPAAHPSASLERLLWSLGNRLASAFAPKRDFNRSCLLVSGLQ